MMALTVQDLLSRAEYEQKRDARRREIIQLKKRRRIAVGDQITLVFENRETMLFQIQEIVRTERIYDPQKIQEEVDVYNTLLPGPGELSATLFIEMTGTNQVKELLDSFRNIDRPGALKIHVVHDDVDGEFEGGHSREDKISAVHFVRFRLPVNVQQQLAQLETPASLIISHPHYRAEASIPKEMRQEWLADLHA